MEYKEYEHKHLELCKCCEGTGITLIWPDNDILHQLEPTEKQCVTCSGTGRVYVSKETTIFVEPYVVTDLNYIQPTKATNSTTCPYCGHKDSLIAELGMCGKCAEKLYK